MLEKIKELGLEKFAGDETQANAFVEGFTKEILEKSAAGHHVSGPDALKEFVNGFAGNVGKGFGGLVVSTGVTALANAFGATASSLTRTKFLKALEQAIASNRLLQEAPKAKVIQYAETIHKFAPQVSTDPNLLSSVLANAIHGEGVDPQTIKSLTDLEGRFRENSSFTPKTYV